MIMPDINKAVETALKIAADNTHGYDQDSRLGNPDYDCSSFVSKCLRDAGFKVAADSWTGNLYDQLINMHISGFSFFHPQSMLRFYTIVIKSENPVSSNTS